MSKTRPLKRAPTLAKAPLSSTRPLERPTEVKAEVKAEVKRKDGTSQVTLKMRASLHRELARLAFDSDMTMRGFIMNALKNQGLSVKQEDLVDRRRK